MLSASIRSRENFVKQRWDFFKESDSSFGLFYPSRYVVAGFDNYERAKVVKQALLDKGIAPDDVEAASGPFVVNEVESQDDANWLDHIKAEIARGVGTEAGYIDDDLMLARRGGAFVFIYAPEQEDVESLREFLKRMHPIFARHYNPMGIVQLSYPPQTSTL